ncbi:hypothetical protein ACQP1P_01405 [Dactylosporangium sp. CA-052675]|uniref:hypothetical protein n=1 Tax=Dactylosporangium sp. CA-052675 TaxID=3239927 RepID=UPI003D8A2073
MKRKHERPEDRLHDLLAAAGAPGRRHELRGEEEAVAGFRQEYRPRTAPARRPPRKRRLLAVVATAVVAAGVGGTAFAASTGHLPAPVQTWFDSHTSSGSSPTSTMSAPQLPRVSPSPSPRPSTTPLEFCRAWNARADKPVTEELRRELSRLAGGEAFIDSYCRRVLGTVSASPSAPPPRPATSTGAPPTSGRSGGDDQGENDNSGGDQDNG